MATTKKQTTTKKKTGAKKKPRAVKTQTAARKKRSGANAPATPPSSPVEISREERWRMIAVTAYHKAEQRGFAPGHEVEDWLAAEREIDARLGRVA